MSFYLAIAYLIAEYMRPQQMYSSLSDLPLAQIAIIGVIMFFIVEGRESYNFNFQNIFILAYLFWFFISYLFAFRQDLAWHPLVDFTKWVIIYFLLINIINDRKRLYIFLMVFLLLNFKYVQFVIRIWINKGFYSDPRGIHEGGGVGAGFFRNPNDLAVSINSIIGISYYMMQSDLNKIMGWFKMRWFHIVCTISIPIAILATSSRGAALTLGVTSLALWYKSKRKIIGIAVLIITATAFISLIPEDNWARFQRMGAEEDRTSQTRLALWHAGIRMVKEYPLTGVGPNNFVYVNTKDYFMEGHQTVCWTCTQHNIFIQAASELGYPGLIFFIMMILGCFYNQKETRKILREKRIDDPFLHGLSHGLDIGVIGFVVNGSFVTVLYYPFFWILLILSVALLDFTKRAEPIMQQRQESKKIVKLP